MDHGKRIRRQDHQHRVAIGFLGEGPRKAINIQTEVGRAKDKSLKGYYVRIGTSSLEHHGRGPPIPRPTERPSEQSKVEDRGVQDPDYRSRLRQELSFFNRSRSDF